MKTRHLVKSLALVALVVAVAGAGEHERGGRLDPGDRADVQTGRLLRALNSAPVPGGSLDPLSIPKYVTPLVIPPVMHGDGRATDDYDIAVRQFKQQILPGGIWNSLNGRHDAFPATPVWSYGPENDPTPGVAPDPLSQFNYPAYTVETTSRHPVRVRWRNELVKNPDRCDRDHPSGDRDCDYLPHLLPVDQTLHWANPPRDCRVGPGRTDCAGRNPERYTGPVPIVTHVHGAHVEPHSDGFPEAWWLPAAGNIPAGYARMGTLFDDATGHNPGTLGYADFQYRNDQPATTLWYHDHSLGMTRVNVYAGPAGFWLIRGGTFDRVLTLSGRPAVLPGPAPAPGDGVLALNSPGNPVRRSIREIPIAIQDRSFNADGTLFYPGNRAFFEGLNVQGTAGGPNAQFPDAPELRIPFVPTSDVAPIWNPEAFFNTMVVNGVTWPQLEVAPARYRFRLLDGCDSRALNLALTYQRGNHDDDHDSDFPGNARMKELPFVQIGAEQGFLPRPVEIRTGFATPILHAKKPNPQERVPASNPQQALLMMPAERADVIVDFSNLPDGTIVTLINTAPDSPFGGFPDVPADAATTGQIIRFVVDRRLLTARDATTTDPYALLPVAEPDQGPAKRTRQVTLNELESDEVCVDVDGTGDVVRIAGSQPETGCLLGGAPFGPEDAMLGLLDGATGTGIPLPWTDTSGVSKPVPVTLQSGATVMVNVTENPSRGDTEDWEIYNFTEDGHPIHLHMVRFEVVGRRPIPGFEPVNPIIQPWERGYKDTVLAYPGEITTVRATYDIAGLFVWHCHIVEHEDNEMMRPYVVSPRLP